MKALILITQSILILIFFLSCSQSKEVKILGYAYKGENIKVMHDEDTVLNFNIEGITDSLSVCSFYKTANYKINRGKIILRVVVDSNSIKVLDTFISVTQQKEPFISILYPYDLKDNRRKLFVGDEADSTFLKY